MGGVGWGVGAVSGSALCRVLGLRGVGGGAAGGAGERVGVYMGREWEWGCASPCPPAAPVVYL